MKSFRSAHSGAFALRGCALALFLAASAFSLSARAETIAPGETYSQDFNNIGTSGTASLPSGWTAINSAYARSVTQALYESADTKTGLAGNGSGNSNGIYNWVDAGDSDSSDHAVGFLASGTATKTGNLYLTLTASGPIPDFTISYDMKCFRNNTRAFQFQLYYSTDSGATWTSAGSSFLTTYAVGSSGVVVNPAGVAQVSGQKLNVSRSTGETIVFCWSYSVPSGTTTSNAQGLGIDNVSIVAGSSSGPAPLATPSNLAVTSRTDSGFSLSWTAVADADDYEVAVLDSDNNTTGSVAVDASTATAVVTGLSADTAYTAKAKAVPPAGSTTLEPSGWSTPVSVRTKLADGLEFAPIFDEPFSGSANNSGSWQSSATIVSEGSLIENIATNAGWTGTGNMRKAPGSVLFGTSSVGGSVTTPRIALRENGPSRATVRVYFQAAKKNDSYASSMAVKVSSDSGTNSWTIALPVIDTSAETDMSNVQVSFVTADVSTPFTVTFEPAQTDGRCYLDNVIVEQIYDPNYAVLPAPTGVAGSDIGKYGFTVSWGSVADATGYEVLLDGATAGSCASTDTSMEISGLSDGTTYSVQVRALGDDLHFGDSPLSTAVSVTTVEDVQKIDFTVTGAPAGDVFAGDAVSFTVTAENESTHAAAEVAFSGITGAMFTAATGAFSWTPTESDVGPHTATFTSGSYSTNVAITVVSATTTRTLATENFSKISSTSWTSTSGYATEMDGDIGTWTGHDLIKTKKAVILGRGSVSGTIISPAIDLPVRTPGSLSVSFDTGSLPGKKASVQAQILDAADDTVLYTTNFPTVAALPSDAAAVADAGARFTVAPGANIALSASIRFSLTTYQGTGDDSQRAYVDTVVFTQTLSAKLRDLDAPTGLAVVGDPGETGFTVGWTAVANATNYAVRVTDAAGAVVFSAPFCAATSIAVTGLADDVSYTVQVRATGDDALYFNSPWSDGLAVRTARSALHPTLSFGPWTNAAGEENPVATLANTAPVAATLAGGADVLVEYVSATPAPDAAPTFADGTLTWTPAETDAEKNFTLAFSMAADQEGAPVYTTNVLISVRRLPVTAEPVVTVANVAWNSFELQWEDQYRASDYLVRVWTGTSDPNETGTEYSEDFEGFPAVKPDGWIFENGDEAYPNSGYEKTRLAFKNDGSVTSPELSGSVTNLSFEIRVDSGSVSVLTVEGWNGTDWVAITNFTGATLKTEKKTIAGLAGAYSRFRWVYEKKSGGKNCGLGSIVFSGTGLPTARFLSGWETPGKSIGKVTAVTVAKPVPGRFTGRVQNPQTGKWEDAGTACVNYAEVTVVGTDGKTASAVVAVPVPFPPASVRATLMILK